MKDNTSLKDKVLTRIKLSLQTKRILKTIKSLVKPLAWALVGAALSTFLSQNKGLFFISKDEFIVDGKSIEISLPNLTDKTPSFKQNAELLKFEHDSITLKINDIDVIGNGHIRRIYKSNNIVQKVNGEIEISGQKIENVLYLQYKVVEETGNYWNGVGTLISNDKGEFNGYWMARDIEDTGKLIFGSASFSIKAH